MQKAIDRSQQQRNILRPRQPMVAILDQCKLNRVRTQFVRQLLAYLPGNIGVTLAMQKAGRYRDPYFVDQQQLCLCVGEELRMCGRGLGP